MSSRLEKCAACRYWEPDYRDRHGLLEDSRGLCRRHAPRPTHGQFEHQVLSHLSLLSFHLTDDPEKWSGEWEDCVPEPSYWPGTSGDDWCGEYEAGQ